MMSNNLSEQDILDVFLESDSDTDEEDCLIFKFACMGKFLRS